MGRLTLAFLDGHYISDVVADDWDAAQRSTILAHALAGAFDVVARQPPSAAFEVPPFEHPGRRHQLLKRTAKAATTCCT